MCDTEVLTHLAATVFTAKRRLKSITISKLVHAVTVRELHGDRILIISARVLQTSLGLVHM
jgi:hypothetical protein